MFVFRLEECGYVQTEDGEWVQVEGLEYAEGEGEQGEQADQQLVQQVPYNDQGIHIFYFKYFQKNSLKLFFLG